MDGWVGGWVGGWANNYKRSNRIRQQILNKQRLRMKQ